MLSPCVYSGTHREFQTLKIPYFVIEKCMGNMIFHAAWVSILNELEIQSLSNFI